MNATGALLANELEGLATRLFINGSWVSSSDGGELEVTNPATGRRLARVSAATPTDVDAAVKAARAQFDGGEWSRMNGVDRRKLLLRFADLIERDAAILARTESTNVGKTIFEPTVLDIPMTVETLRYFAGWADKIEGRTIPTPGFMGRQTFSYTVREPIGVVAAITPWNSPTMILSWKIAPALAAGCTLVIKPSPETPLTTLHLARLAAEAGFPAGVFNVVPGDGQVTGAALVRHPGVDKISFTGGPEAGVEIQRNAAAAFKRTTMELGGKCPQIVLEDADIDAAIGGCCMGIFVNQGEVCAAGSRVLVHKSKFDQVLGAMTGAAKSLPVGDPFDPNTKMGPLISERHAKKVEDYVKIGVQEGAKIEAGGSRLDREGSFFQPTILSGVKPGMRVVQEEIFGPVAVVMPFSDIDEAMRLANGTQYGLAASIWTRDVTTAHSIASRVRAGAVAINGWSPIDPRLSWGGVKKSGHGRELGWPGIEACTEEKTVTVVM